MDDLGFSEVDSPIGRPPPPRPLWMPSGGRAALYFWGGLALLLAIGLIYFFRESANQDRANRLLRDQVSLYANETGNLHSQIDKLQSDISAKGTALKEVGEQLQAVKAQTDQQDQLADQVRRGQAVLATTLNQAVQVIAPPVPADPIKVWAESERIVIRLPDTLLFDGNDTALNAKGTDLLKKVAAVLKPTVGDQEIDVESFTDAVPSAPTATTAAPVAAAKVSPLGAWDFSSRRACAVVRILADGGPLDPNQLSARALGTARPIASNDTADRIKNRRIEIVLQPMPAADAAH